MIHDVDESLRALVRRDALNGSDVEVSLEAPTKEWAAKRGRPTVNLYLYDIREDMKLRNAGLDDVRGTDGFVKERRMPARRYRLSYLVTAWTQRPEDEHGLLSALLDCFIRHEKLPDELLQGVLLEQGIPVKLDIALPPNEERSLSDIWSAMGGELKPSLDLVAIAPLAVSQVVFAGPPVMEEPRISFAPDDDGATPTKARPVPPRRPRQQTRPVPVGPDEPAEVEEQVVVGKEAQKGRIVHVRAISRP